MNRVDGTSARQLDLDLDLAVENRAVRPVFRRQEAESARPALRLLRRDVYAELARRRRRAQIAARHELERG
jgi:hypothetical protein